jgi:hypothetical protein
LEQGRFPRRYQLKSYWSFNMGPGFYVIAILGCADGSAVCTPVATMTTRYESRDACAAATGPVLAASDGFDFPTLLAQCRPAKAPAADRAPVHAPRGSRQG